MSQKLASEQTFCMKKFKTAARLRIANERPVLALNSGCS